MLWKGSKHLRRFMSSVKDLPVEDVVETFTAADMTLLADSIKALSTEDGLHETTEKYEAQKTRVDQMLNAMKNGKSNLAMQIASTRATARRLASRRRTKPLRRSGR